MIRALVPLLLGIFASLLPIKTLAADRITFNFFPWGQFYIQVEDLEAFVTKGEVSSELAYYLKRLTPEQVAKLPELLSTPLEFHPLSIAKFSNSIIGEAVIKNFGKGIRANVNKNGFFALRSAIIAAAFDEKGLTVLNLLHQFPLETIYIDLAVLEQYIERGEKLFQDREAIDNVFFANNHKNSKHKLTKSQQHNLSNQGQYIWQQQTLIYNNPRRPQHGHFDLYQPEKEQAPLIVITHGLASNRQTFSYLGEHLASHGFAVAIIEHDDISLDKFGAFLSGAQRFPEPNNLIDQPLDVKYVLDKLQSETQTNPWLRNKINLQQVGVIGQSFGGYTSLALAGGKLIAEPDAPYCQTEDYKNVLLDLSSLAKCSFNEISDIDYRLKDPRVKAVIAINPMGKIFGREGMASIDIPTMFISGTNDLMMPPMAEQIKPFTWLDRDLDKHLVLVKPATHFSFLREGLGVLPVPDRVVGISPTLAYPVVKALSTAFFQTHLARQSGFEHYLHSDRFDLLENYAFEISIIRSLTDSQLQELINSN